MSKAASTRKPSTQTNVLTVLIIFVLVVIAIGLTALYREVGLGRGKDEPAASNSHWPFGNLTSGNSITGLSDNAFTGFLAICSDDTDALGAIYSVAVVAEEWYYPLQVAVGRTLQPNGWRDRLESLPGNVTQREMSIDEIGSLQPSALPVAVFLNEGRVLDASLALDSPSAIARSFQRCRFGLARGG